MVGLAPGSGLALPRPDFALRTPGFRRAVQADHLRSTVVPSPAVFDHRCFHGNLRAHRQPAHRRPAPVLVLYVRHGHLVLFCPMPQDHLRHLHRQSKYIRQGLLPTPGDPHLNPDLQHDHLRHSVPTLHRFSDLLHGAGFGCASENPRLAAACVFVPHGGAQPGLWHHRLLPHHQVPRPTLSGQFWRTALDVRHPRYLSRIFNPRRLALGGNRQPHHTHCGSLSLRLFRRWRVQLGDAGLQLRCDDYCLVDRRAPLQPR